MYLRTASHSIFVSLMSSVCISVPRGRKKRQTLNTGFLGESQVAQRQIAGLFWKALRMLAINRIAAGRPCYMAAPSQDRLQFLLTLTIHMCSIMSMTAAATDIVADLKQL